MISRYDRPEISSIWSEHNKFETYLKAELAILKALEGSHVPKGISEQIKSKSVINPERIQEIEKVTKHDIISFCTSITENLDPQVGKYFHFGVTSSDIIDTALTIQIKQSLDVILPAFKELLHVLSDRAHEVKELMCMGRSHGMFAEPMSFGQKWLGFYSELSRRYRDLKDFYDNDLTVQFSGAVGNYTILTPELEKVAADILELNVEPVSTQVIPRDRIAKMISIIGLIGTALERIAVEIRHLHHSDIDELHEGFSKGQKGSSTMPHKKNPISGENLTGMARMLRSHVQVAMDNILLWHERDISHSSTERMYLPDNFGILYYSLVRMTSTVKNLVFHEEKISSKVEKSFTYLSSYYLHQLILNSDFTREELYELVQKASFEGHQSNSKDVFFSTLQKLAQEKGIEVTLQAPDENGLREIYLKNIDRVYDRVMNTYPLP